MLKVTFHTGALDQASTFNQRAMLDIGYDQLDAIAAYKAELFRCGTGEGEPIRLGQYPRWSASVWDLVMRMAALGLWGREEFPEMPAARSGAYMTRMCVIVEHWAVAWPTGASASPPQKSPWSTAGAASTAARCGTT